MINSLKTTKVWRDDYGEVESAIKASLERLKLDYVDLYLIHWMVTDIDWENKKVKGPTLLETWKQIEKVNEAGLAKSIGVSNCPVMVYLDLLAGASITPAINQIEANPYIHQSDLIEFTRKWGTETTAYAPMGAATWTGNDMLSHKKMIC